ncbi:MAG: aminopeptidase N [Acetobacteraceae bacterium]|nr:aminopeptidase N [Acetobacteraceae bacterium]
MTDQPVPTSLADYHAPEFLIDTVDLHFDLDPAATIVRARLAVRRAPHAAPGAPLVLDGEALTLLSISRDGTKLGANHYQITDDRLVIAGMPDACTLEIETRIAAAANTALSGLYVSGGNFFTQCEAQGFRRITYFPDRPDVMARYTTTLVANRAQVPVLLSNGNPVASGEHTDGRHWARWEDPHPKPSYLFAVVAGDLVCVRDRFRTRSGRDVALGIWVRRGDEDRCAHAMSALIASMRWDEKMFGLEYDLDVFNIAAVSDFNMGAMENKGLNVFNTKYVLAKPDTATDADYEGIETVIAHEYFHNWTGNRVTCRDWFQLSLKEGLTVFRDQEFSADQGSRAVKRIADVRRLRAAQFPEDAGPLAHPVQPASYIQIDNFYTATIYQKGAEVIRMIQTLIGREAFRRGMDLYFQRHDNQAVTIGDFIVAMQDAAGMDLSRFKLWYHQAGTPDLHLTDHYDAAQRRYTLTLRQATAPTPGQPDKAPQIIPVAMGLLAPDGSETATRLLILDAPEQSFVFDDIAAPPIPSLLRGFSAPVKLHGMTPDRLRFLAAHDTDRFVCWESGQQYATLALLDMSANWRAGQKLVTDTGLLTARSAILAQTDIDPAFAAEAFALPGEAYLADQMEVADIDALHAARQHARAEIGRTLAAALRATYDRLTDRGVYTIDGVAIGRRALRNTCLAYLAAGDTSFAALAHAQCGAAQNMTDVLAALVTLAAIDGPYRTATLATFHAKWRHDDLVLDKWFAIQAMSSLPGTVDIVRALASHADFDLANPNRVRALVSSFVSGNPKHFHDATGAGYRFLADIVMQLDRANPQVAARIVSPLGQWRRVDAARQTLMRAEAQRILDLPGLSRNTYEIVSKSLSS